MNKIEITGRLARNAEVLTTKNGGELVRFTVAVRRRKRKGDTQTPDADFIRVTCFGEGICNYAKTFEVGDNVGVVGHLQIDTYEKNGVKMTGVTVIAENVEMIMRRNPKPTEPTESVTPAPTQEDTPAEKSFDETLAEDTISDDIYLPDDSELPF